MRKTPLLGLNSTAKNLFSQFVLVRATALAQMEMYDATFAC